MLNINYEDYFCGGFPLQIFTVYYNNAKFRVVKNHSPFNGICFEVQTIKPQDNGSFSYYKEVDETTARQLFELLSDSNNDEDSIILWLELNIVNSL